jgi:iron(III) transport system substrate-binding protein
VRQRAFPLLAVGALLCAWWLFQRLSGSRPLVVYCAHDSIYAEAVLRDFTDRTGLAVAPRYDTESTKSLGLVELLVREKEAPRCDVFWNNELLGTLDLQEKGVLAPYRGSGWERIPAKYKEPDGHWTGFAARMRVEIKNTALESGTVLALAKPLYGTTLTHYAVLWQRWGREPLIAWHRELRQRGAREMNGNGAVKDAVAAGVCAVGFTDTDDFFAAQDARAPVTMRPIRLDDGATICIPNTVAIVRGTPREADARQLVDFLLSAETELALARSKSRQIPLGPVPADQVPAEVRELAEWAKQGVDLTGLGPARAECLDWLKAEYLR